MIYNSFTVVRGRQPPGCGQRAVGKCVGVTKPLDKRSLRDQVVGVLRQEILAGAYRPGQRLSEPELARRLNVSLTPVREALGVLAGSGLVTRSGRQGTHVRQLHATDIENLLAVREVLEVLAVRQAMQNLTPEDAKRLGAILEAQERATELVRDDPTSALPLLIEANDDFHALILQRSRNEWLSEMLASIQDLLGFARARLRAHAPLERRRQSLAEHRRIAEALLARDGDAAASAMSDHIQQLKRHLIAPASDTHRANHAPATAPGDAERSRRRRSTGERQNDARVDGSSAARGPSES